MSQSLCSGICAALYRNRLNPGGCVPLNKINPEKCPGCAVLAEILRIYSPRSRQLLRGIDLRSRTNIGIRLRDGVLTLLFMTYHKTGVSGYCVVITAIKGKANPWGLQVPSGLTELDMYFGDSTSSPQTLSLASSWLNSCLSDHQACINGNSVDEADPLLPSRVIDISGEDPSMVKLVEPAKNARARYMCLSYCWGGAYFIRTTTRNIQSHLDGIPRTRIPAVFRDFIQVARYFHVNYVWIDSLCIIQDDTSDWERESGNMAAIYRNSFLTVAAAAAVNPYNGLFALRETTVVADCVQCRSVDHLLPNDSSTPSVAKFPLASRAWAYQEQILSPRVLSFGPYEIFWHCQTTHSCECGQYGGTPQTVKDQTRSLWGGQDGMDHLMTWHQAVEQYTKLSLTKWTDRLPAFSGIAEYHMAESRTRSTATYRAGLWSDYLPYDLLWYHPPDAPRLLTAETPKPWTAPSWSWASRDRPVQYDKPYLSRDQVKIFCQVLGAECILAGESKTGQVKSGYLKLRCPILEARQKKGGSGNGKPILEIKGLGGQGKYGTFRDVTFFDELGDNSRYSLTGRELHMMRLVQCGDGNHVLILAKLQGPGGAEANTFTRVGIAWYTERAEMALPWPRDLQDITLI